LKHYCVALLGCVVALGCLQEKGGPAGADAKNGQGIDVNWGSGSFKLDPKQGLEVRAPGVDVQVDPNNNVNVKTPQVEVRKSAEEGVVVERKGPDNKTPE
jgi:hypothetical protein